MDMDTWTWTHLLDEVIVARLDRGLQLLTHVGGHGARQHEVIY